MISILTETAHALFYTTGGACCGFFLAALCHAAGNDSDDRRLTESLAERERIIKETMETQRQTNDHQRPHPGTARPAPGRDHKVGRQPGSKGGAPCPRGTALLRAHRPPCRRSSQERMSAREPEPAPHYMAVTADNLETPVAVFDDLDAMCRWARISKHVAYCMISRGTVRKKGPAAGCRLVNLYPLHKKRPGR